jgi:hypothetical protein
LASVAMRALDHTPGRRPASALEMALDLEEAWPAARTSEVGKWVERLSRERLDREQALIVSIERYVSTVDAPSPEAPTTASAISTSTTAPPALIPPVGRAQAHPSPSRPSARMSQVESTDGLPIGITALALVSLAAAVGAGVAVALVLGLR